MSSLRYNDFVIQVATANGSGSQSANNILVRSLFRMGLSVGGKNLFPSNIQGLPTWFTIRAEPHGFVGRRAKSDVLIAMNPATAQEDLAHLEDGGFLIFNSDVMNFQPDDVERFQLLPLPCKQILGNITDSVKLKKLLVNMIYVGVMAELLHIEDEALHSTIQNNFSGKESVAETNIKALQAGREFVKTQKKILEIFPFRARLEPHRNREQILMDGNTASALGMVFGGCQFVSWYPITPSSSVVENYESYARKYLKDDEGRNQFAVVQAEDELSAIAMVLGAGWAGARSMTATSGPGLSLMAEAAGLSYFAEIPAVIWDVQRVGPSTGLPTRTLQGDLLSAHTLSHGDSKHPVLLPASVEECFTFGRLSLDLAAQLQTLVLVLTDLDLGMNFHMSPRFTSNEAPLLQGKVLSASDLEKMQRYYRYEDVDQDGVTYRTLPGTPHPQAAYFTRGTGHNVQAKYSERPQDFVETMDRLNKKWETIRKHLPEPEIKDERHEVGLIFYGSTALVIPEVIALLAKSGLNVDTLRIKALPFSAKLGAFIEGHSRNYLIEQNRDGQMKQILALENAELATQVTSILNYDGLPLAAEHIASLILAKEVRQ